jgi:hypothetical protein
MLDSLTKDHFVPLMGDKFRMEVGADQSLELELIQVTPLPVHPSGKGPARKREPFSLIFRGPLQPYYPQQIYPLTHGKLGQLELFLVPIGSDGTGMRYEAIFN